MLFDYRTTGKEVTLSDDRVVYVRAIREDNETGIFARVRGYGKVQLWTPAEASAHNGDTETQMVDRLKEVM